MLSKFILNLIKTIYFRKLEFEIQIYYKYLFNEYLHLIG